MLALLTPLKRAADQSKLIRDLVKTGEIFHPVAWTPQETHRFLKDIPSFESSGVMVRIPDWWHAQGGRPARPKVSVSLGGKKNTTIGLDALLDFSVNVTLDGEELTPDEWRQIRQSASGLILIRGKWVEIDRDKLSDLLASWEKMGKEDFRDGISFARGMQLLSGAGIDPKDASASADNSREWLDVNVGKWLEKILADLRSPEKIDDANPGELLKTTLRPYQQAGVNWLWFMNRLGLGACLADDMGLGKTIQILALLLLIQKEGLSRKTSQAPSLLVVPASLVSNWKKEIERFAPSIEVFFVHSSETPAANLAGLSDPEVRKKKLADKDLVDNCCLN